MAQSDRDTIEVDENAIELADDDDADAHTCCTQRSAEFAQSAFVLHFAVLALALVLSLVLSLVLVLVLEDEDVLVASIVVASASAQTPAHTNPAQQDVSAFEHDPPFEMHVTVVAVGIIVVASGRKTNSVVVGANANCTLPPHAT